AWDRVTGSADKSIVVGIMDTGIALDHPDLKANLVPGRNFFNTSQPPADDQGHGTHVAGIVGAAGNNSRGVVGVNWRVGLMPLKVCNASGQCDLSKFISALQFAANKGVRVANASFGGNYPFFDAERDAIQAAGAKGLMLVAAAGNFASDNDTNPTYPAGYALPNVISVAASNEFDELAGFSNFGAASVHLAAPGDNILSTGRPKTYVAMSGTSMAAPYVAGAAALVWSQNPGWSLKRVRDRLLQSARPLPSLAGKVATCGRLDLAAATNPSFVNRPALCVTRSGTGLGKVTSSPAGIDCGSKCTASYKKDVQVTLTATPAGSASFAGWQGACTGTGTCKVTMSAARMVTAVFRAPAKQAGWANTRLAPPAGRDPFAPGSLNDIGFSFYNVATSASGDVRAKTVVNTPQDFCYYDSSDTGGVYVERRDSSGKWQAEATIKAPKVGSDGRARWANCAGFGSVTKLSADGSTLLISQDMAPVFSDSGPMYRCAAFVFRKTSTGWKREATLFPRGITATGSPDWHGCAYFGLDGDLAGDGQRVAILSCRFVADLNCPPRADVFVRSSSGKWSREQTINAPNGTGCGYTIGPGQLAMSGKSGATLLLSDDNCDVGGQQEAGRVHIYTRSGSQWSKVQTINSPEPQFVGNFGRWIAVSRDGSTATFSFVRGKDLPFNAGGAWLYERSGSQYQRRSRLTAAQPQEYATLTCSRIVRAGARILCGAFDRVGFNSSQGSIHLFERPSGGWPSHPSPGPKPARLFVADGLSRDLLGAAGQFVWPQLAAPENGAFIYAPIAVTNLANGRYPKNRIGFEFKK
ncbi:MAG TPA: S8 family serine peptidase, partial [Candidatus Limnocylindria bacterium]|nr:S8 family serine peptidase [Candidatus Limnocylindria bacterium]